MSKKAAQHLVLIEKRQMACCSHVCLTNQTNTGKQKHMGTFKEDCRKTLLRIQRNGEVLSNWRKCPEKTKEGLCIQRIPAKSGKSKPWTTVCYVIVWDFKKVVFTVFKACSFHDAEMMNMNAELKLFLICLSDQVRTREHLPNIWRNRENQSFFHKQSHSGGLWLCNFTPDKSLKIFLCLWF